MITITDPETRLGVHVQAFRQGTKLMLDILVDKRAPGVSGSRLIVEVLDPCAFASWLSAAGFGACGDGISPERLRQLMPEDGRS